MALNALTLSTTQGVQGRPFQAAISGLTTGRVEVLGDASPGFSVVNGKVMSQGLPYPVSTVSLREYEPGVGQGYRDTRIDITALTRDQLLAQAIGMLGAGRTMVRSRVAGNRQADGTIVYSLYVEDDLGATAVQPAGQAPVPAQLLRVVGTAGEVNYLFTGSAVTTGTAIHEHRTRAFIGPGGVKAGTARISNHAFRGLPGSEPDAPGYLVRSHIEYNGVAYVSTYGGAAKGTVPAGGVDIQSDPHTGCPDIPAGALVWIVRRREYAVGVIPHYLYNANFSPVISGQGYNRGDGSGTTAIGVAGPMPGGTGWTAIDSLYAPPVLLGEPITPSAARPFIICGASIEFANNDATGDGANGAGAYMRRALADGGGTKYPWINMAVGSESSAQFIAASTRRRAYLQYAAGGCAVNGYGGNDFTGGATPDDTWANFLTINGYFKAAGILRTAVVRAHVKSNSTDNYATTANQTPRGSFPSWRASMDAKAAASLADGTIGLYLDDSAAIEAPGNIWKAPGYTVDGTHPEKIGHDPMWPIVRTQMANGGWL